MDNSLARLYNIEAQRSTDLSQEHWRQRYIPMYLLNRGTLCVLRSLCFLHAGGDTESVPSFLSNLRFSDLYDLPGESVQMSPEIFTAVSAGKKEWLEKLRSHGTPMACLKSDRGDSVLHLAAAWGRLELVKSIVSECPSLLLEPNSKDQLPLHVAAHAGHLDVVEALVATITYFSFILPEEERERLNLCVVKDIDGDTPLHLALKGRNMNTAACLVCANQRASFLADKDGISPLYMAVGAGIESLVKAMLHYTDNDGLNSQLEGGFNSSAPNLVAFYCGVFVAFAHVKALSIFLNVTSAIFLFLMIFILGPHVILQIPGIPALFGVYFVLFVMLVDENSNDQQSSAANISERESTENSSEQQASAANFQST